MLVPKCITGVVHASVDVDVGNDTNVYNNADPNIALPPFVSVTSTVYDPSPVPTAVNTKVLDTVVPIGVVNVAVDVNVKSDQSALFIDGCTLTVHTMLTLLWITGVVHASVDVDVGKITAVYATGEPLIAVPPLVSTTPTEYDVPPPGTALNVKLVSKLVDTGVVNVALLLTEKSAQSTAFALGCTLTVHTSTLPVR